MKHGLFLTLSLALGAAACSPAPAGLAPSQPADTTVKMDFYHRPFPDIPLPNDVATRYDEASATGRRINASMLAPTSFEARTRELLDRVDGWGLFQPITIPFTGPLDVASILKAHRDPRFDPSDDVVYLVDIDPQSAHFGELQDLDVGGGSYPYVLEDRDHYYKNDPRGGSISLPFEEADEDLNRNGRLDPGEDRNGDGVLDPGEDENGNGVLDPPEDTDADGILDAPNYLPGAHPAEGDLAGRADALMTFYEASTSTLILRPMVPLRERTRYAVVVTRRLLDGAGKPVGSPYPYVNHAAQTEDLEPLLQVLPSGLSVGDIAFAFSFTTQSVESGWKAVRDGLYARGVQAQIGRDFPAEVASLEPMRDAASFPGLKRPQLLFGEEWKAPLGSISEQLLGSDPGSESYAIVVEGTGWVDYYVIGSYVSPQLFERTDASGAPLGLNDQSWPEDLDRQPVHTRAETVYFTLAVPRKEVSVRAQGKPAPLVLLGHGYTGNRFDVFQFASFFARQGLATIAIDAPSHGIGLSKGQTALAKALFGGFGIEATADAIAKDRAFDQNGDDVKDSGADFWTAYMFHTRDMVRQYALDNMQLLRILKTFDGQKRWSFDTNGDGSPDLAGDFDGDGQVDVGGSGEMSFFGASLGAIVGMVMGSVEPGLTTVIPISGGGGLSDVALRSVQGGVGQAFVLRGMGPLYTATLDATTGTTTVETIVVDLNGDATFTLGAVDGLKPWDTMVVENLHSGVRRCGFLSPQGTARAGIESNAGDPTRIVFYRGPQIVAGSTECEVHAGAEIAGVIDTFGEAVTFQVDTHEAGSPLVALAEGLGLRRSHPDLRRFQGLGQMILDPTDPAVLARHAQLEPMTYGTGETTGTHLLVVPTMGDMSVPVNAGVAFGRAAGLVDWRTDDPRYGKSANQELIDTHTTEAVNVLERYVDSQGNGVHLDIENFAEGQDLYGAEVPRLSPPMRLGMDATDLLGGKSAFIVPYDVPEGEHGFDSPGGMTDRARAQCKAACTTPGDGDPCACAALKTFDIGSFMLNLMGRYVESGGKEIPTDACQSWNDCPGTSKAPAVRDESELR